MQEGNLSIYPVPNHGAFTASFTSAGPEDFSIRVYNQLGEVIFEKTGIRVNKSLSQDIDLGTIPPGFYTVVFQSNESSKAVKILVNY